MRHFVKAVLALFVVFMSVQGAQAASDLFTIRSGDVLQVTVWKEEGMDREVVVLPDGSIDFPLAGSVSLQGLTTTEAQALIKTKLVKMIPDASVSVTVKAPLGHTVNVMGQVVKPGEILMGRKMTVMQALSQAGGLTAFADEDSIVILRTENGEKKSIQYSYDEIADGSALEKEVDLIPGDVIMVPSSGLF